MIVTCTTGLAQPRPFLPTQSGRGSFVWPGPVPRVASFLWAALLLLTLPALVQAQTVQSFSFTGAPEIFVVPAGVTSISVVGNGAEGGNFTIFSATAGKGGQVKGILAVTPGQSLTIYVGGQNGFNGGGSPSGKTDGGGGATDIRMGGTGSLADRVLVAGGGGGGSDTDSSNNPGGDGGSTTAVAGAGAGAGGGGGESAAGGAGGILGGSPGTVGSGGAGSSGGGGGGGGYFGGGGGGEDANSELGGGGGGSSYTDPTLVSNVVHTQGANTGDGSLTITIPSPSPTRLYVKAGATAPGDGLSWATAFPTIEQATTYLNNASLTEIFVASGIYSPTATLSMLNNVGIYGSFSGVAGETSVASRVLTYPLGTTISGGGTIQVFYNSNLNNTAILDGVVIAGGNAASGGGMFNSGGSPLIRNCLFISNSATNAGGAVMNDYSTSSYVNCAFVNNSAPYGGAISCYQSAATFTNCSFQGNASPHSAVLIYDYQNQSTGTPVLTNCVLWNNPGGAYFGGLTVPANNCLFPVGITNYTGNNNLTTTVSPFVSATDLRLNSIGCDPAINGGDNAANTTTTDLAGQPRVFGTTIDMGAYEFQATPFSPTHFYVKASATGANTGLNWTDAFTDLQSALTNSCVSSVTAIWVAAGTYKPTAGTDRTVSFRMLPNVAVYGGFPNAGTPTFADRNPASFSTILSGDIGTANNTTDNSYHVVYYGPGSGAPVLDGVIISGGNANGQFTTGNLQDDAGGGMLINSTATTSSTLCNPQLTNVTFESNIARDGGAFYLYADGAEASPVLTNCRFVSNTATNNYAGAIYTEGKSSGLSNLVLTDCLFRQNFCDSDGGALYLEIDNGGTRIERCVFDRNTCSDEGGAIYAREGSFTVISSQFLANTSGYYGGAIFQEAEQYGLVTNCLFDGNTAPTNRGGAYYYNGDDGQGGCDLQNSTFRNNAADRGGAIYVVDSGLRITNCLIRNNTATDGGGIYNNSSLTVINTTVASNTITGTQGGGIYSRNFTVLSLINTIVWGNTASGAAIDRQLYGGGGTVSLQNSLVQDGLPTGVVDAGGNVTATQSPFVTNYQLNACTPAINAGDNAAYASAGGSTTDLAGLTRIFGGNIDMGAYEFQGTPNTPVSITAQPVATSVVCAGATVTASVSVCGTAPSYQWYKGATMVTSQTTATLSLTNVQTADAGSYSVVVTGACNSVTSTAFSLTVNQSVGVTIQPAATSVVCTGATVTVFISATGDVAGYQWFKGTTAVSGATSATLTLANVQPGATDGYTAMVLSTSCGVVLSSVFNLTVTQNVGITVQPAAGTLVCSGATVTQTVSVSGTGPYGFQWIKGTANIAGQTTATLSLSNVQQIPDADGYTLRVIGTCNSLLSNTFNLSVNQAVAITAQPVAQSVVCVGSTVTAMVSVSGSGPYTYEWIKGITPITGQTTATLSLTNVQPGDTDSYFVRVITPCNNVLSTPFALTVQPPVTMASVVSSGTLTCAQTSVTLTTTAANATSFTLVNTGASNATGQFTVSTPGSYSVRAGSTNSCTNTAVGSTSVSQNTAISGATLQASSGTLCAAGSVTLTAGTGSNYAFTGPGLNQSGAGNTAIAMQGGTFSVVITGVNGCTPTASTTLTVVPGGVALGLLAAGGGFCEGTTARVPVSVTGSGGFQWYRNGQAVSGQTSATLTFSPVQAAQAGSYVLVATGSCSSATSTAYNLAVGTVTPNVVIVLPNSSSVTVSGAFPTITFLQPFS